VLYAARRRLARAACAEGQRGERAGVAIDDGAARSAMSIHAEAAQWQLGHCRTQPANTSRPPEP
jgi:hypothetical protein